MQDLRHVEGNTRNLVVHIWKGGVVGATSYNVAIGCLKSTEMALNTRNKC